MVFVAGRERLHFSTERYLVNRLREQFGFFATPIRIQQRLKPPKTTWLKDIEKMNKNDISKKVYETHGGLSYADSQKIVDLMLETIKKRLVAGRKGADQRFRLFQRHAAERQKRRESSDRRTDYYSRQECGKIQTIQISGNDLIAMSFVPKKLYYKIREVCEIVGVEAHVLRFWESEFPALSPPKSKTGQRTYRPKDIELLLRIKKLLYEEGFTIAGARKRLSAAADEPEAPANPPEDPKPENKGGAPLRIGCRRSRLELENILTLLDRE